MEHVYGKGGTQRCIQRIFRPVFLTVFDGCDICRETQQHIRASGFQHVDMEEFEAVELTQFLCTAPQSPMIRPHISGTATK